MEGEKQEDRPKAPGLRWIKRRDGYTPMWVASAPDFKPRTVNLGYIRDNPQEIVARCVSIQAEMNAWKAGLRRHVVGFDGTLASILKRYQTDPESSYFSLRPNSRRPYDHYIAKLAYEVGQRRIDSITGIDLKRWHNAWSEGGTKLAASKTMRAVLDAAITFAIMSFAPGTAEQRAVTDLREALKAASRQLPNPKRREFAVTADDVVRLRQAAHDAGRPSMALAYAIVFETTLRIWDVIGQWVRLDTPLISDIHHRRHKWFGLQWGNIDRDLVLRCMPSKSMKTTGRTVTYPLALAPMVVEELAFWPVEKRVGPVIISEATTRPYRSNHFSGLWRKDCDAVGLPQHLWARDLRASGITEGRTHAATIDDTAKVAGHASTRTTAEIYDRAALAAAERFASARAAGRKKPEGE